MSRILNIFVAFVCVTILLFTLTSFYIPSENIQIRIFSHLKINSLELSIKTGTYNFMGDGNILGEALPESLFKITIKNDSIQLSQNDKLVGCFKFLNFVGKENNNELKLKLNNPDRKLRTYQNNLGFSISDATIRIINDVILDNYVAGVTEAEAGSHSGLEFYKVQTILARTFALGHINKHSAEGFSLCDQVHCQVYYGKPKNATIFNAVVDTKGKVVVDENLNLIVAAFHSNSGGQTANSEDVWGTRTSYLKGIIDTFSTNMPNFNWERKMLTDDWLSYLKLKHNFPISDSEAKFAVLNFKQLERKIFLEYNNYRIPLKSIRQDFQLKSTFFTISEINKDSILFKGRGYGHGLGMCQEGAMRMSKLGYNYNQILNFYYKNIQLIDLHKLSFFKDE